MAKPARTFTALLVISGVCLAIGSYLAISEVSDNPLSRSSTAVIVGATFIALGVAALFSGIKSYRHHLAVLRHIRRRHEGYERVRVKKRRQATPDP